MYHTLGDSPATPTALQGHPRRCCAPTGSQSLVGQGSAGGRGCRGDEGSAPPGHRSCIPSVLPTRVGSPPVYHVPTMVASGVTTEDMGGHSEWLRGPTEMSLGSTCHQAASTLRPRQTPASHDPTFCGAPQEPLITPRCLLDHQPPVPGAFPPSRGGNRVSTRWLPAPSGGRIRPQLQPSATGQRRPRGWRVPERPPGRVPPPPVAGDAPARSGTGRAGSGAAPRPHPERSEPSRATPAPLPAPAPAARSPPPGRGPGAGAGVGPTCAAPSPSPSAAAAESRCRGGGQRRRRGGQCPLPAPGLPPAPPVRPALPGPGPQPRQRRPGLPAPSVAFLAFWPPRTALHSPGTPHPRDRPEPGQEHSGSKAGMGGIAQIDVQRERSPDWEHSQEGETAGVWDTVWEEGHSPGWGAKGEHSPKRICLP